MRRPQVGVAVNAQIAPALIVGKNDQNVRTPFLTARVGSPCQNGPTEDRPRHGLPHTGEELPSCQVTHRLAPRIVRIERLRGSFLVACGTAALGGVRFGFPAGGGWATHRSVPRSEGILPLLFPFAG